jgi:hypothetical protein
MFSREFFCIAQKAMKNLIVSLFFWENENKQSLPRQK